MQEHQENPALDESRMSLRARQREHANTNLPISSGQLVTDIAIKRLEQLTQFVPTKVPHIVRRGAFNYDRDQEGERIARAKAIIGRVAPGPLEDPSYFAVLAYQAASIEMAFEYMPIQSRERAPFSKYLLGTVHTPYINAFAEKVTSGGYTIIVLYSGLVDFLYQAAKVVVEALNPSRSVSGRSAVRALFDLEVIRARLDSDPRPTERLYRTLEAYFFYGYPRASAYETPPEEHYPVLSLIVGMAERWVISHEYGHGLAPSFEQATANVDADWGEEYFADVNATIATVFSAGRLDSVPPEFPLGAALFALACLNLLRETFDILSIGKETGSDPETMTHPKPRDRAVAVINCFRQFFDVNYHPNGSFDLGVVLRTEAPNAHNFSNEHINRAYSYANVLQTVWKPVKERFLEDFRRKRPLHPLWR